jgi:hypothetical protein
MRAVVMASVGLAIGGPAGALAGVGLHGLIALRRSTRLSDPPIRPILILLLVELRSGRSSLGALQEVSSAFPGYRELELVSRIATISGLSDAVLATDGEMRAVLSQLARAQRSGAALADTVRSMIEADIAAERARRVARARTLPVRLMIPITLLVLPGLVLLFYAPSLLRLFEELSGPLS